MALQDAVRDELNHSASGNDPILNPLFSAIVASCFLCLLGLLATNIVLDYRGSWVWDSGRTSAVWPVNVEIAGTELQIPANYFRFEDQRIPGHANSVDLHAIWPGLNGYSNGQSEAFNDLTHGSSLIYLSLSRPDSLLDTSARFLALLPYYKGVTTRSKEFGLSVMSHEASVENESLYFSFDGTDQTPFVTICDANPMPLASCRREIHTANGLSATIRFRKALLSDWPKLESKIRHFVMQIGA